MIQVLSSNEYILWTVIIKYSYLHVIVEKKIKKALKNINIYDG